MILKTHSNSEQSRSAYPSIAVSSNRLIACLDNGLHNRINHAGGTKAVPAKGKDIVAKCD